MDEKRALVVEWRASGLSAREFSESRGITKSGLWNWAKLVERETPRGLRRAITFAPVHVTQGSSPSSAAEAATGRVVLEALRTDGLRVRMFDGASSVHVEAVIAALSRSAPC
jgi:hypothetical protein